MSATVICFVRFFFSREKGIFPLSMIFALFTHPKPVKKNKKGKNTPAWIAVTFFGGLIASYFIFPGFNEGVKEAFDVLTSDDESRIESWVAQFGMMGPVVIILAMTVQMFLFIVPNVLLMMIAIIS